MEPTKELTGIMTEGSILKQLIRFAVPMFFCSLFQQLYSTADAAIVGRYAGTEGLAAIGVTSQIIMLAVSIGLGLMLGISVVVSEHCGAGNWDKVRQVTAVSVYVVFVTWILKLITGVFLAESILRAVNTPEEVLGNAVIYLRIVFGGGLFTYAYSMCIYIMRACGNGSKPLLFLAFSSICNVFLDLFFVRTLQMGVAGAAVGTVIAESLAAAMCLIYIRRKLPHIWPGRRDFHYVNRDLVIKVMKLSVPSCLQIGAVSFCTILVQSAINRYGTTVVAGYTAAQKIELLMVMGISAITGALNTFTAQNRGAGKYERIKEGMRTSRFFTAAMTIPISLLIFMTGKELLRLFAGEGTGVEMIEEGFRYLQITCGFYLIMGLLQVNMAVLRGMADVLIPLVIGGLQVLSNLAAIWLMEPLLGKEGIWWSTVISWSLCFLFSTIRMKMRSDLL